MSAASATVTGSPKRAAMLRSLKSLHGYKIAATDGDLGAVHDFLFEDDTWMVRYLVVNTSHWLPGRRVLLSPAVMGSPNWQERTFSVSLTRERVRNSPEIEEHQPVSRQREAELHRYYDWPFYWTSGVMIPGTIAPAPPAGLPPRNAGHDTGDPHLRSAREVTGYRIQAEDGEIGKVEDFVADDESWAIRYLVVATHKWLPGRKVLIAPEWMAGPISWSHQTVRVFLTREAIRNSPAYDPEAPINREYEALLYDYYGRPRYWA